MYHFCNGYLVMFKAFKQWRCPMGLMFMKKFTAGEDWKIPLQTCDWQVAGYISIWGQVLVNSIMVSLSISQAGRPGSSLAQSVYFRKVEVCLNVINLSPPVPTTGSPKAVHVLSCLCDNACKRSPSTCRKSRISCPVSRLLSVFSYMVCMCWTGTLIWLKNKQTNKQINKQTDKQTNEPPHNVWDYKFPNVQEANT